MDFTLTLRMDFTYFDLMYGFYLLRPYVGILLTSAKCREFAYFDLMYGF